MTTSIPTAGIESDPAVRTLGTVLHAVAPKPSTAESVWVALVQAIAAGDQRALRELYGRMHAIVFTLILRIVHDKQTAEELTIDVFHDIWKRAGSFSPTGGSVVGWVMNQARSRAIDQLRFESRKKRVNPYSNNPEAIYEDDLGVEIDSLARDKELRDAVGHLAPPERSAIETAFFSDCTYAETAVRLNQPPGTIKTRIRAGLHKLRHALTSENP